MAQKNNEAQLAQNQLMDMKKSTRNLISLSGVYANMDANGKI